MIIFNSTIYTKAFLGLLLANMFFWMSNNFFLPILPIYYHTLGMSDHQIGIAIGAFSIGAVYFAFSVVNWQIVMVVNQF